MSDQEFKSLVEQLKNGDNRCLKFIFEDHSEFCIKNLLRNSSCTLEEAEDIFMDAVINFREKAIAGKINYMTNIRNYIYTTCLNMQRVNYQTQKRISAKQEEVLMYFQTPETFDAESDDDLHNYEETMIEISMKAFQQLDQRCQQILKNFYVKGVKMAEIAQNLGLANANVAKTVKSRCYKKWMEEVKNRQEKFKSKDL